MAKRVAKAAAKLAAYEDVMKVQPTKPKASKARWINHSWDQKTDSLRTRWEPGFFPRRGPDWHREGSLDEIEQKENAGQRDLF